MRMKDQDTPHSNSRVTLQALFVTAERSPSALEHASIFQYHLRHFPSVSIRNISSLMNYFASTCSRFCSITTRFRASTLFQSPEKHSSDSTARTQLHRSPSSEFEIRKPFNSVRCFCQFFRTGWRSKNVGMHLIARRFSQATIEYFRTAS